jgi:hypothetical protein
MITVNSLSGGKTRLIWQFIHQMLACLLVLMRLNVT